jgi:hypothetical protein
MPAAASALDLAMYVSSIRCARSMVQPRLFVFVFDAGAILAIKIAIGPMLSPLDTHAPVGDERWANRSAAPNLGHNQISDFLRC